MRKLKSEQSRILKNLSKKICRINKILIAIVFGSFARGDYGPKSDVDLLVIVKTDKEKDKVKDELIQLTEDFEKDVQVMIRSLKELKQTDTGLLKRIFREGKIISLKNFVEFNASNLLNLKPFRIYYFDISKLKNSGKVKFSQALYGQKVGKYKYKGVVDRVNGIKLGSGCVLVPEEKGREIDDFFKYHKVEPETIECFI